MNDQSLLILSVIVCCSFCFSLAVELTFELPDNAKDCFYEEVPVGTKATVEFQVVTGGHYDVDMILTGPSGNVIYKNTKQQYDSVTWTADIGGIHKVCFSNEFSTISHKIVYLDFQVGDERPLLPDMGLHATAMTQTQMESSTVKIHESMKDVIDYQTHFRLREAQGRKFAEDLNERVFMWSIGQSVVILIVGIGQVLVLKNFFTEKKNISGSI